MTPENLNTLLKDIRSARLAIIGDFCLDSYWFLDASGSEISIETRLPTRAVSRQHYSLGGAGNVAKNLAAMNVAETRAFGVIGDDPFGREMTRLLQSIHADVTGLLTQKDAWNTHAYTKPYLAEQEENRIDFGNFNRLADDTATMLINHLENALPLLDTVIINEQVASGIHNSELFRNGLSGLIARHPEKLFLVDSRHYSDTYSGAIRKINAHEALLLCGVKREPNEIVTMAEAQQAAETLFKRWRQPLFVTRGERGCLIRGAHGMQIVPGLQILGQIDTVGAGDSMLAGLAAALAVGRDPLTAATLGNLVAGVTIQKLFQTGTASPEEIMAIGQDPDYVYRPELADDERQAQMAEGLDLEIVSAGPPNLPFTHAIFDHDGTISTLRQGWEQIMAPMMMRAILGDKFESADETLYHKVSDRVHAFIDKTTGIQTISQMSGLVEMVREFGFMAEKDILDAAGYKAIFNNDLMRLVRERIAKLERYELTPEDFTLKNAPAFLVALHRAGIQLYLASGTDQEDVINEARALGYAHLFGEHIYGAEKGRQLEAKKIILERILNEIGTNQAQRLITFGDGPVEIRATHKRGGVTVGVASDEIRRFGLNHEKRSRLIRAGADYIIPDFSQLKGILTFLGVKQ